MAKHSPSFQALVAANRSAGRLDCPTEQEAKKKMEQTGMRQTGMRLWPEELKKAKELAASEERSAAGFMRRMYLRGLEAYMADAGTSGAQAAQ